MVLLPPTGCDSLQLVGLCDGILLPGGPDIDPSFYHEDRQPACGPSDKENDHFQLELYRSARKAGKPVLGICRGCQLINVAEGGTLYQDYRLRKTATIEHPDLAHWDSQSHAITIQEHTVLEALLQTRSTWVNSLHHQCIAALAPTLTASATSTDGVVEAIETKQGPWCLGVQWHPESLGAYMDVLFTAFVEESEKKQG